MVSHLHVDNLKNQLQYKTTYHSVDMHNFFPTPTEIGAPSAVLWRRIKQKSRAVTPAQLTEFVDHNSNPEGEGQYRLSRDVEFVLLSRMNTQQSGEVRSVAGTRRFHGVEFLSKNENYYSTNWQVSE